MDKTMHIRAGPDVKTLNLRNLMEILSSSDAELWEQSKWMFDGTLRYLDGTPNKSQKVGFCSFPRSGNTFLRKYVELLTGVWTGADNPLHVNVTSKCKAWLARRSSMTHAGLSRLTRLG